MDFNYTFKQAHQDRLEDARVKNYRPQDGFRLSGQASRRSQNTVSRQLRVAFAALVSIFVK